MNLTDNLSEILKRAANKAVSCRHEFIMPEHVLFCLAMEKPFVCALQTTEEEMVRMLKRLDLFFDVIERVPGDGEYELSISSQTEQAMIYADRQARCSGVEDVDVPHVIAAILHLEDSYAHDLMLSCCNMSDAELMESVICAYEDYDDGFIDDDTEGEDGEARDQRTVMWRKLVTCINEHLADHNPLVGREAELERTIQVLCRKDKNNPLHIGEPGVGKTALVYGLAARIEAGNVPDRLKEHKIYSVDLGTLIAGTQFRGDFEKRIKSVMEGVIHDGKAIVYIDEVHNLVGAGKGGDGALDASNMLKPYLEKGNVRFIGSTTYQEFNRHFAKSKGIVRRFQQIDIAEPSAAETVEIMRGLRSTYEDYHNVVIPDDTLEYAVEMATRHIADRFLPDKAIDLIDEACAYRQIHPLIAPDGEPLPDNRQTIDRQLVNDILAKVCKIDAKALKEDDNTALATLAANMKSVIYGQDEAVNQVVEAVQMSKAGLLDDGKPIASLLFVGPTGVGKTEVARVLAMQLGVELVRFDMSEYTEKHAVAKLIGSPAGYVGYEDGGLLVDAIRKTPNCVLLLDEIEKAHADIYNIMLQVMDYARLTDNKGQKADFRNAIIIMTSNAGAQYASQASIGFAGGMSRGEAMMAQVKKTFKPEFINRLSGTVVFRDMDEQMADLILAKKLRQLDEKLAAKNVSLTLTPEARRFIFDKGFTRQYGAREIDRVIQHYLNPLLMREILFGTAQADSDVRRITVALDNQKLAVV